MKHEHVFTQMDQTQTPEGLRTFSKLFPQDRNIKLGWKTVCTLLYTIAPILECINVTLNECRNHPINQTTVSLLKAIPKLLPVHSETYTPKDNQRPLLHIEGVHIIQRCPSFCETRSITSNGDFAEC